MPSKTEEAASTAIAAGGQAQLEVIEQALRGESDLPAAPDPEAMSRAIMERILAAESFEEAFTQQDLTPWRSLLGVPVIVAGVHFNRSTVQGDGSPPIYAVCDLEKLDDGSKITVTCGGRNVLAQLIVAIRNGWLSKPVRMIENDTAAGFGALWLEAVEV